MYLQNEMGYSQDMISLLKKMLELDEFRRAGVNELTQILGRSRYTGQDDNRKIRSSMAQYGDFNGNGLVNDYTPTKQVIFSLKIHKGK